MHRHKLSGSFSARTEVKRCAAKLNEEGIVNATGQCRVINKDTGPERSKKTAKQWASTGIRELLRRDLYRGIVTYGKTRNVWKRGARTKVMIPEKDWISVPVPHLRIVSESLWKQVQDRIAATRQTYPGRHTSSCRLQGRREAGLVSKNLLSGFLRCGVCGGNMFATARSERGGVKRYYLCTTAHTRGSAACTNSKGIPYTELTDPESTDNPHAEQRRVQGRVNAAQNPSPMKLVPPG